MSSIRQQSRSRAKHPEPRRPAHPPHRAAREAGGTRNPARFFSFVSGRLTRPGEAHPDHGRRWAVGLPYSGFHLLLALFAPLLVQLFVALPVPVIAILTGLALILAFVSAAEAMLGGSAERDPALLSSLRRHRACRCWESARPSGDCSPVSAPSLSVGSLLRDHVNSAVAP